MIGKGAERHRKTSNMTKIVAHTTGSIPKGAEALRITSKHDT